MVSRRQLKRAAGFSLIEMLLVVGIGIILLGAAAPMIRSQNGVSAEVRRVVADIVRVRSWARTTWRDSEMDIDVANRRWRLVDDEGDVLDSSSADANGWRTLADGVNFEQVGAITTDFGFAPDGQGLAPASIRLSQGATSWVIEMSALTGTVTAAPE